jgi:hypothetical protein
MGFRDDSGWADSVRHSPAVTVYRVEITDKHGAGEACDALRGPVGIANRRESRACGGADGKQLLSFPFRAPILSCSGFKFRKQADDVRSLQVL